MSSAVKTYITPLLAASILGMPLCMMALQLGKPNRPERNHWAALALAGYMLASTWSKRLVYYRLGSQNVSNMGSNRIWTSPCECDEKEALRRTR